MGFLSGLGDFACLILEVDSLDDTNSYCLTHVTDSETSQGRELLESLNAHRLAGYQGDDGGVTGLDGLRILFGGLAGTAIALLFNFRKFAGDVGSMAIQYGRVSVADLTRVIEHDDLYENGQLTYHTLQISKYFKITFNFNI